MFDKETITLNELPGVNPDELKKVKIILKHGGGEIVVKCKHFSVTKMDGTIIGYEANGIEMANSCCPMYIDISQIAAILYTN